MKLRKFRPQQSAAPGAQPDPRRRPALARTVAAAAVAVVGAIATAAISLAPADARTATTITFASLTKRTTNVPTGFINADVDRNAAGKVIGSDSLNCRDTGPKTPPKCAVNVDLASGDLFLIMTPSPSKAVGSVVTGTGRYAHATGTVLGIPVSSTRINITVTLDSLET